MNNAVRVLTALALSVPLCVTPSSVLAQTDQTVESDGLVGIKAMGILIEAVRTNDCGLTKEDVQTSVSFVLSQSRIRVLPTPGSDFVYVPINIQADCAAASVDVEVDSTVTIASTNVKVFGASIWSKSGIFTGTANMRRRILDNVEQKVKQLVVAWSMRNP